MKVRWVEPKTGRGLDGVSPSRILWEFFHDGCSAVSAVTDRDGALIQVSPNPFQHRLVLEGLGGQPAPYTMMTLSGQVVRSGMTDGQGRIDGIDGLPAGMYVLEAGSQRFRVVK